MLHTHGDYASALKTKYMLQISPPTRTPTFAKPKARTESLCKIREPKKQYCSHDAVQRKHAYVSSAPEAEMHGLHGQSTGQTSARQTMAGRRCCHSWSSCHRKAACWLLRLL